ncbi:Retrovirus-related Pol polyprotein from transposon RE1, partial [Bienertia sinuspersici]
TDNTQACLAGKLCLVSYYGGKWILDSGATDHICSSLDMFDHYVPNSDLHNTIIIPNGSKVSVAHIGSVKVADHITLTDVLHVPDFQFNLISVQKLCRDMSCCLVFDKENCFVQDPIQKSCHTLLGKLQDGLYHVSSAMVSSHASAHTLASQARFCGYL